MKTQVNNVCLLLLASSFCSSLYGYDVSCQVFEKAGGSTKVSGRTLPAYRIANRGLQFCKRITTKKSCTSLSHRVSNSNISNVVTYRNQYKHRVFFVLWLQNYFRLSQSLLDLPYCSDGYHEVIICEKERWYCGVTLPSVQGRGVAVNTFWPGPFLSGWWWNYWSTRFLYYELVLNQIIIHNIATGRTHN